MKRANAEAFEDEQEYIITTLPGHEVVEVIENVIESVEGIDDEDHPKMGDLDDEQLAEIVPILLSMGHELSSELIERAQHAVENGYKQSWLPNYATED